MNDNAVHSKKPDVLRASAQAIMKPVLFKRFFYYLSVAYKKESMLQLLLMRS